MGQEGRSRRVGEGRGERGGDRNEGEGVGKVMFVFTASNNRWQAQCVILWHAGVTASVKEQSLTFRYRVRSGSSAPPQMSHYPDQQLSQLPQRSQPAGSHKC